MMTDLQIENFQGNGIWQLVYIRITKISKNDEIEREANYHFWARKKFRLNSAFSCLSRNSYLIQGYSIIYGPYNMTDIDQYNMGHFNDSFTKWMILHNLFF